MKRLESYLRRNDWLLPWLRLGLVLLFLFWVIPGTWLARDLISTLRKDAAYQRAHPYSKAKQLAANAFADQCLVRARKLGDAYGPKEYFTDLMAIHDHSVGVFLAHDRIGQMQMVLTRNRNAGRVSEREFKIYQQISLKHLDPPDPEWVNKGTGPKILYWLVFAYLKMMLIAGFTYLLRMVDDRGILETVLADKRKFIFALFDWPHQWDKYPRNVVREIVVEAELRRIGGFFRRFNPIERLAIREIANAPDYQERLAALRQALQPEWQRGILLALLGTLFCLMFLPRSQAKETVQSERSAVHTQDTRAGPILSLAESHPDHPESQNWSQTANLPEPVIWIRQKVIQLLARFTTLARQEVLRAIDHVPLLIAWSFTQLFVDQAKGDHRERENMVGGCQPYRLVVVGWPRPSRQSGGRDIALPLLPGALPVRL